MKKEVLIIATLVLAFAGCRSRNFDSYGNLPITYTYTAPNTNSDPTQYYPRTYYATPSYDYYNYTYTTYTPYYYNYSYPGYYTPRTYPYYYNYPTFPRITFGHHNCSLENHISKLNLAIETMDASDTRNLSGKNLRAQTFGKRTEVEYRTTDEKINFLADQKGSTWVSGKVLLNGELTKLDPKKQKCKSTREKFEEDPAYDFAKFNCTDGQLKISAEVLIPKTPISIN